MAIEGCGAMIMNEHTIDDALKTGYPAFAIGIRCKHHYLGPSTNLSRKQLVRRDDRPPIRGRRDIGARHMENSHAAPFMARALRNTSSALQPAALLEYSAETHFLATDAARRR